MKYKDGVFVAVTKMVNSIPVHLLPTSIVEAVSIADKLSKEISGKEITITSILDGVHSKNSLHYSGNAFDLRIWYYTEKQKKALVEKLALALGKDFDVIDEGDHIHVEHDKKV
jgi:hypothetical protein